MNEQNPAISVIIPLYNAEKYIRQCLESMLDQTFENFEVIVVDDCSTDNSVEVVEDIINSAERGHLIHLIKRNKNSGGAAIPRNVGLRYSHGKYIAFCDNDDMFTTTALEDLYEIAEETRADILHAQKFLSNSKEDDGVIDDDTELSITSWESGPFTEKPLAITENIGERVKLFTRMQLLWNVWNKLFRRDFITQNYLEFPDVKIIDDMMFCFECFCLAKTYVIIPNIFNIYRMRQDSHSHNFPTKSEYFQQSLNTIKEGVKILDTFMSDMPFFRRNSRFKHMAINFFVKAHLNQTIGPCTKNPPQVIEEFIKREFHEEMGGNAALVAYLFNLVNNQYYILKQNKRTIARLKNQLEETISDLQMQLEELETASGSDSVGNK